MADVPSAALTRLQAYNSDPFEEATNPYGMGDGGHRTLFPQATDDVAEVGQFVADAAGEVETAAEQVATDKAFIEGAMSDLNLVVFVETEGPGLVPEQPDAGDLTTLFLAADGEWREIVVPEVPEIPQISPISLTSPTDGATNIGSGGTYTFVGTDYGSLYGFPQTERRVNIYLASDLDTIVETFETSGAGTTVAANFTGVLNTSTAYFAEMVYEDSQGNTAVSDKVAFTTAAVFKPGIGQAYEGGFLGFENFGDGGLFDLITAAKSTEAAKAWQNPGVLMGAYSRLNGPANTAALIAAGLTSTTLASGYADQLVSGGKTDWYVGAIDELRAISSKLKPSAATAAAFQSGGAEEFPATGHWTSSELTTSNALRTVMTTGAEVDTAKTGSSNVRAIRRVAVTPPYPIGTAMEGGYLAAYFTDLSSGTPVTYMLIVADKATEVTRTWSSASVMNNFTSRTNGKLATDSANGDNAYPALKYGFDLVSGAQTDWYLPAIDELRAIYGQRASLPSGQGFTSGNDLWSSTEIDASSAKTLNGSGNEAAGGKTGSSLYVRPIRRVPLAA